MAERVGVLVPARSVLFMSSMDILTSLFDYFDHFGILFAFLWEEFH